MHKTKIKFIWLKPNEQDTLISQDTISTEIIGCEQHDYIPSTISNYRLIRSEREYLVNDIPVMSCKICHAILADDNSIAYINDQLLQAETRLKNKGELIEAICKLPLIEEDNDTVPISISNAFDFFFDGSNNEYNDEYRDYITTTFNGENLKAPYPEDQTESTIKQCVMCGRNGIRTVILDIPIKSPIDSLKSVKIVGAKCTLCGEASVNGRELRAIECIEKSLKELFPDQ